MKTGAGRALWLYFCEWVTLSLILSYCWKLVRRIFEEAIEALINERVAQNEAFDESLRATRHDVES